MPTICAALAPLDKPQDRSNVIMRITRPSSCRCRVPGARDGYSPNYLTATVLVLGVAAVVGYPERWSSKTVLVIAGTILTFQWLCSTLWLRRYR